MTTWLGWFCFLTLSATAALHVYWALGGLWPASDMPELVRTVIGTERNHMPPAGLTVVVASLMLCAGLFALARGVAGWDALLFVRLPLGVIAAVLLVRGAATYLPGGPFARATEPFAHLNALYFSPLILALGLGFAGLALAPRQ
jgi:hypothetical protein